MSYFRTNLSHVLIYVLITAQGGLQALLNPLPAPLGGALRQEIAHGQIDTFLDNF